MVLRRVGGHNVVVVMVNNENVKEGIALCCIN
jgi:hypothetical protein